jgi:transposase
VPAAAPARAHRHAHPQARLLRRCGRPLVGDDPQPLRFQVLDLPPIKPEVIEYQLHRLACPCCRITTCGRLPADAPRGGQGPRLQALVGLLTGAYRLSKRQVEQLLQDVFAIPLCAGQVCAVEADLGQALEPVVAERTEHVRRGPANVDETGWREDRRKAWLWVAVGGYLAVYPIVATRGAGQAKRLLGEHYASVLGSDRWSASTWVPARRRQVCWAHRRRDFQAMVDRQDAGSEVGQDLLGYSEVLFEYWYKVRDGTRTRRWLRRQIEDELRPEVRAALEAGAACGCAKTAGVCAEILKLEPALWTFARHDGVEPTNNAAERALRHAVLWRRMSHGTASAAGSRLVANILSVVETSRLQARNVWGYLTSCCEAAAQGVPAPSLLPQANS